MPAKKVYAPTSKPTQTYTPFGQRFSFAFSQAHWSEPLQRLARLRRCHPGLIHHWQCDLQAYCQDHAACADGRLPYDDHRAVTIAGPVDHLGDAADLLRDALDVGVLARRRGHLHLVGFKLRYRVPDAHRRAAPARRQRDQVQLRARAAELQRRRRARAKADRLELRAQERWPSMPPQRPPGSADLQGLVHVTHGQKSLRDRPRCHSPEQVVPAIIRAQKPELAHPAKGPKDQPVSCDVHPTFILRTPIDALKRILEARNLKSQRIASVVPLKPLHLEKFKNPLPPAGGEGGRHVCSNSGGIERPIASPQSSGDTQDAPTGSDGSGQAVASGDGASGQPGEQASSTAGKHLEPALFAQILQHLVRSGCGRPEAEEAAKQMLGADYGVLAAHRRDGKAGMAALAAESEADRPLVVQLLCRKQAKEHTRRQGEATEAAQAAQAAAKACRQLQPPDPPPKPPQAAVVPMRPPAEAKLPPPAKPRHCYQPPAHRDRRAPRVRGQPAGQLPAGACTLAQLRQLVEAQPDLPRIKVPMAKILALGLSPERVALAFQEAKTKLRNPQALGWAALTRLQRLTGDRPRLGPR